MSLRLIEVGNSLPHYWPVDLSATFQAGQVAQLTLSGNAVVCGVSNGGSPIGLIDDTRTKAFSDVSWDETVETPVVTGVNRGDGVLVTPIDIKMELENPNVFPDSFISIPVSLQLIPRNGVVVFPAGTPLNYDKTGGGIFDSIKTNVRYSYRVTNVIGEDTTAGSNRVSVWFQKGIYQVDVFDTTASYPLNANLFVNQKGRLTTTQLDPRYPPVGIVLSPPTTQFSWLEFLWL